MLRRAIICIRANLILVVILAGFFLLSGTGLFYNYGLATTVNDETPPFVAALKMIAEHTLRPAFPTFYYLPIAAYAQLPFAALALLSLPVTGIAVSTDAIREFVILDFAKLLPFARLASLCYGVLAIYLLYRLSLSLLGKRRALITAFLFSTSFLYVQLAHVGRTWILEVLLAIVALSVFVRLVQAPTLRNYLFSAVATALSFGISTIGVLVYVPFVVAHKLARKGASIRALLLDGKFLLAHAALFCFIFLLYYLNPYGLGTYVGHIKDFLGVFGGKQGATTVVFGENARWCGEGALDAFTYYVRVLSAYELPLMLLALLGVITIWRRGFDAMREGLAVPLSFGATYIVGITSLSAFGVVNCEQRYILPAVPIIALLGSFGVFALFEKAESRVRVFVGFLIMSIMLYGPIMFDIRLALPSTRIEAREWVMEKIPDGSVIVNFDEKLELPENTKTLTRLSMYAPARLSVRRLYLIEHPEKITAPAYFVYNPAFGTYGKGEAADYLIIFWWNPEEREPQLERAAELGFSGKTTLVRRFPADATDDKKNVDLANNVATLFDLWLLKQNGPTIDIYRVSDVSI